MKYINSFGYESARITLFEKLYKSRHTLSDVQFSILKSFVQDREDSGEYYNYLDSLVYLEEFYDALLNFIILFNENS